MNGDDPTPDPIDHRLDRVRCAHCDRVQSEHQLVNFADGPHVGAPALICPTAVFQDPWTTQATPGARARRVPIT
jgi:hypothetical protein